MAVLKNYGKSRKKITFVQGGKVAWIDSVSTRGPVSPHKACQTSTASGHRHTQTRLVNGSAEYSSNTPRFVQCHVLC